MKLFLSIFFLVLAGSVLNAQQNEEFEKVQNYFEQHRRMIATEFSKQVKKKPSPRNRGFGAEDYLLFMNKLDSLENTAYLNALVAVKNREDLLRINKNVVISNLEKNKKPVNNNADYPGGFNKMKDEIAKLVYTEAILNSDSLLKTYVDFIVEQDGRISSVQANGFNPSFNRQAEIALYRLPERFSPATIDGIPVRHKFRLPLTLDLSKK